MRSTGFSVDRVLRLATPDRTIWSRALLDLAAEPRFREALLWQNRAALHGAIASLLRTAPERAGFEARRKQALVASYVQRYSTKNETIGFFGPIAWGRFVDSAPACSLRVGTQLLARRRTYFEHWCIDALALAFAGDEALLADVAPRRRPTVRVEGRTVWFGLGRSAALPEAYARLLAACDGTRSARAIAVEIGSGRSSEVCSMLCELRRKELITWTLEVPTGVVHPERELEAMLQALDPSPSRTRALAGLERILAARNAVANAAGDPPALDAALENLDRTFVELTGRPSVRHHGEMFAARTLVFEECLRDLDLEIGAAWRARLAPALAVILQSARWFTFMLARRVSALCRELHAALAGELRSRTIDYPQFWARLAPHLDVAGDAPPIVREVATEFRSRWAEVLAFDAHERRVNRTSAALEAAIERAFAAPHPGWPSARHHSPDLLPVGSLDGPVVLGEVHAALNTITAAKFLKEHSTSDRMLDALQEDLGPRIAPVDPKRFATHANNSSLAPLDLQLETGETRSWRPRQATVAVADLVVEEREGRLEVRSRDGERTFDLIALLDAYLTFAAYSALDLLPRAAHRPRVTIDQLIVCRERWLFTARDLAFAALPTPELRFENARRFAHDHLLPRFVFVRTSEARKPVYVDFDSPVYVDALAKLARKVAWIEVEEMLPSVDEFWLPDREGGRYGCELRIVCVDPEPWRPIVD